MATIGSETEQVSVDPTNTVEYGGAMFVKLTASTYDVELQNGNKLVIDSEKAINEVEDGVPTSIQGGYSVVDPVPQYTFSISATPADATIVINDETRTSITTDENTEITWSVSKTGYVTQTGTHTLVDNYTETVVLEEDQPVDTDVIFTTNYYTIDNIEGGFNLSPYLYTVGNETVKSPGTYITLSNKNYYVLNNTSNNQVTYDGELLYVVQTGWDEYSFVTITNSIPSEYLTYNGNTIFLDAQNFG